MTWEVTETNPAAKENTAIMRRVVGRIGTAADGPLNMMIYTPAKATRPVPLILLINFGGGPPVEGKPATNTQFNDPPVAADILARGWGYAMVGYQDIQPDRLNTFNQGVIGRRWRRAAAQARTSGERSARGRGASAASSITSRPTSSSTRRRSPCFGHSRLGKTALWASALDERIAAVYASCSGEMGAALARRDWGETVDDMAQNFPVLVRRQLSEIRGPLERHAGRCAHADRAERSAAGVHHRRHRPTNGQIPSASSRRASPPARSIGCSGRRISGRPNCRRSTRRSPRGHRLALPHRRPRGDAGRLERVPGVRGEVLLVA